MSPVVYQAEEEMRRALKSARGLALDADRPDLDHWFGQLIDRIDEVQEVAPVKLDVAWAETEAALPRDRNGTAYNTSGGVGLILHRMSAVDYRAKWGSMVGQGSTPAAALRALAAKLRERAGS